MKPSPRSRQLTIVVLCALLFPAILRAQASLPTLESLAAIWAQSTAAPRCSKDAGGWDKSLVSELCVFRESSEPWARHELAGERRPGRLLESLTWQRSVADSAGAFAFGDSVGQSLRAAPMQAHECPGSGRMWQAAGLYIHFNIGAHQPNGRLNVMVLATTLLLPEIAALMCPGVDLVPLPSRTPRGRIGDGPQSLKTGS